VIRDIKEQLQDIPGVDVCLNEASLVCYTGYDLTGVDFHPAWSIPDDSELATKAQRALREIEMDANPTVLEYCTNGSHSAGIAGIPTIVYGPPSISLAHAIDEYVEIQDLNQVAMCFQALARTLLQGKDDRQ
jgi:acetylornithine deacetylase/succinyl-diaminopimelate desuccinylase-like protein